MKISYPIFILKILFIFLSAACSTSKINYSSKRIFNLEDKGYEVQYNEQSTAFVYLKLDSKNIDEVIKDNTTKTIYITAKDKNTEFISVTDIAEQIKSKYEEEVGMLVIDGIVIPEKDLEKVKIEKSIYKSYEYLTLEKLSHSTICRGNWDGGVLVITTEEQH